MILITSAAKSPFGPSPPQPQVDAVDASSKLKMRPHRRLPPPFTSTHGWPPPPPPLSHMGGADTLFGRVGGINVLGHLLQHQQQQRGHLHGMPPMTSRGALTHSASRVSPSLQMQHFMAQDFGLLQDMLPSFIHGTSAVAGNNNQLPSSLYGKLH